MIILAASGLPVVVVQLIAFVILAAVLYKFVITRIREAARARSEGIQSSFDKIDADQTRVETSTSDYERRLKESEAEGEKRVEAALKEGESLRGKMQEEARSDREKLLGRVEEEIRIERDKAVIELQQEAAHMAVELAERMVAASVDDSLQKRSVDRYLEGLDKVRPV